MAIVQVQCETGSTIGAGSLWLQRVGGSILMSNFCAIDVGGTADARKWQALMGIDSSAGASPSYIVTTTASNTAMIGEAKMLAISGVTGAQSVYSEVDIDNTETTLVMLSTSLQAGDNIVIAIFETINTGTGTKSLSYVRLKRSATLAESQLPLWHGASGTAGARQCQLIPYLDASAPASPTYTATACESSNLKIKGAAKIVAFRKNLQAGDL